MKEGFPRLEGNTCMTAGAPRPRRPTRSSALFPSVRARFSELFRESRASPKMRQLAKAVDFEKEREVGGVSRFVPLIV